MENEELMDLGEINVTPTPEPPVNPFEGAVYPAPQYNNRQVEAAQQQQRIDNEQAIADDKARVDALVEEAKAAGRRVGENGTGSFIDLDTGEFIASPEEGANAGLVGSSTRSNWGYAQWAIEDLSEPVDPTFKLDGANLDRFQNGTSAGDIKLPDEYLEYAQSARNQAHLDKIRERYVQDMKFQQYLADEGMGGTAANIISTLVDPVLLGTILLAEIPGEQLAGSVAMAYKMGALKTRLLQAGVLGGISAGTVAGQRQFDPKVSQTDVALAGAIGAGFGFLFSPVAKNPATAGGAAAIAKNAEEEIARIVGADSVGAARNAEAPAAPMVASNPELDLVPEELIPSAGGYTRIDTSGTIKRTDNSTLRVVSDWVAGDSKGATKEGPGPSIGVFHTAEREVQRDITRYQSVAQGGFRQWAKEQGYNPWFDEGYWTLQKREEFLNQVGDHLTGHVESTNAHVIRTAEELRRQFKQDLDDLKAAGVKGYKDIADNPNYMPMLSDKYAIGRLKRELGSDYLDKVTKVVRNAMDDVEGLTDGLRTRISEGYAKRLLNAHTGVDDLDFGRILAGGDEATVRALLDDIGIDKADADAFVGSWKNLTKNRGTGDPRAKRRARVDYYKPTPVRMSDGTMREVKLADFFNKNPETAFLRYKKGARGRIAMAKTPIKVGDRTIMEGVKSAADYEKLKKWVLDENARRGHDLGHVEGKLKNLDYLHDLMLGRGVSVGTRELLGEKATKGLRYTRMFNYIRYMSNMGVNQVMETANVVGTFGLKAAMQGMPALGKNIIDDAGNLVARDKVARELLLGGGSDGTDTLFSRHAWEEYNEGVNEGAIMEGRKLLSTGLVAQEVTNRISLMKWINSYQKQWAMKAMAQRLADMSKKYQGATKNMPQDFRKKGVGNSVKAFFTGKDLKRLNSLGLKDADIDAIFKELGTHTEFGMGNKVHNLNLDKWDPAVVDNMMTAMNKWTSQVIQRNDATAMSRWMEDPVAKIMFQFRSFVLGAYTKQLQFGLNHFDIRQLMTWTMQVAMGGATAYLMKYPIYAAMTDNKQKKAYWDANLSPERLAVTALGRTGFVSFMPDVVDSMAVGADLDPIFAHRASGLGTSGLNLSMAIDTPAGIANSFLEAAEWAATGKISQKEFKEITRALPWNNYLPWAIIMQGMISDMPAKPKPKDEPKAKLKELLE